MVHFNKRWKKGSGWLALLFFFCLGMNVALAQDVKEELFAYRIGPEDLLEISVWEDERLTKEVLVRPDGLISFPLIGEVRAGGRTASELTEAIVELLTPFVPEPSVLVSIKEVNTLEVYVIGKVIEAGVYVVGHELDVLQALALAKGLAPFAAENKIKVLRREGGGQKVFPFRYGDVKIGKNLEQNIMLQRGDTVIVP